MWMILNKFQNGKIKNKLMAMVMFITTITLVITCTVFVVYDVYTIKQNTVKELSLISDVIGKRTAPALEYSKADKGLENLYDFKSKSSVLLACLYKIDGQKLAEFSQGQKFFPCPENKPEPGYKFEGQYLTLSQDIFSVAGTHVGSIFILSDMREITEHITQFALTTVILMIFTMIIAYFIALAVQRIISKPIESLTNTARIIHTGGHYSVRAEKYYNDEIGTLADGFNEMLSEVETRDAELKNVNGNLEKIVEERTHALGIAVVKAEAANEAKSEFLRNMSHEFRTPLHAMRNFSTYGIEDADKGRGVDELKGYFNKISMVTARLTDLVEGILNIASMESGVAEFVMAKCDLSTIFNAVIAEHEALIKKKNLHLVYTKPDFPTEIICNQGKITQVVANLMGNAIKFTPSGKNITLSAKRDDQATYISMSDEGVGVPEDQIEDIFKKFVQSTRTKTQAGGTGLGLTICMGIVNGHNGKIWAENNNDAGSTFTFTIPLNLSEGTIIVQPNIL